MPLIYITRISGSGKSTIRGELRERGYVAYDVDEDGFKSWYNTSTDSLAADQRLWVDTDVEWRRRYRLKIERSKVSALAECALTATKPTFLCGTTPNDEDIWDLFSAVVHLTVSDSTLRHRLATRVDNNYGKDPQDLRDIMGWNSDSRRRNLGRGAISINAEQPVAQVVHDIIDIAVVRTFDS